MVLPVAFSQVLGAWWVDCEACKDHTVFMYRSNWLDSARLKCPEETRDRLPGRRKHAYWLSKYLGAALPLVFQSSHSWTQLFPGWLEYGEREKQNKTKPTTAQYPGCSPCGFCLPVLPEQIPHPNNRLLDL